MKVLYDYQAFYMQKYGGVSNSFVQLIKNLPVDVNYDISIKESANEHLLKSNLVETSPLNITSDNFISLKHFKGKERLYNIVSSMFPSLTSLGHNRKYSINSIKKGNFDIFHPTFYDNYFLPYLCGKPYVLTIHDMIPEKMGFPTKDMQIVNKRELIKNASHVIAVSEKTKEDIIEILKVPESKVSVIYHGAPEFVNSMSTPIVNKRYMLYVGKRDPYKNFLPMVEALTPVFKRHPDLFMICTGPQFTEKELSLFCTNGIRENIIHFQVDDKMLMNLYCYAECFIYPSLYEGFGIPILEAYKAKCPVLLNRKSCFPEIAQDAALYFNLDQNNSDLESVMECFLQTTSTERQMIINRQNARLSEFSWKKSAGQLRDVYNFVIKKSDNS